MAVTLRNLPPELDREIRERARDKGLSLNKTIIQILADQLLGPEEGTDREIFHDLDDLAGTWTREETQDFDQALREQRRIDRDLWK